MNATMLLAWSVWLAAPAQSDAATDADTHASGETSSEAPATPADADPDVAASPEPEDGGVAESPDASQPSGTVPPGPTTEPSSTAARGEPLPTPTLAEPEPTAAEPQTPAGAQPPSEGPARPEVRDGPPFYGPEDDARLRTRYELTDEPQAEPRRPRWRCLVPDPACGFGVELVASSAYVYRLRQGSVDQENQVLDWNSARASYELWVNFPTHVETVGKYKYTRLTLGPKVGVVASDNQDLWGNFGIAGRYWFGRGAWAPAFEFTSALSFKLTGERNGMTQTQRSPVGITADFGINIGGWGAIIIGGQYDTPLAREELPERFRQSAAGQLFIGFRGNVLWGLPAAAAVGTHVAALRAVPDQP